MEVEKMMIDAKPLLISLNEVQDARARLADIAEAQVRLQERDKAAALARYDTYNREYLEAELDLRVTSGVLIRNLEQQLDSHKTAEADPQHKPSK